MTESLGPRLHEQDNPTWQNRFMVRYEHQIPTGRCELLKLLNLSFDRFQI